MTKKLLWVDPPSGWRYGFPKIWDGNKEADVYRWLDSEGYPWTVRESYGQHFYMRMWEVAEDDNNETV